jgi:hypothetical protein
MNKVLAFCCFTLALVGGRTAISGLIDTVVDTTAAGAVLDGTISPGEYVGTVSGGGSGFGGPVGGATLGLNSDLANIYFGFSDLGDMSNNTMVIYFDSRAGGFADNAAFTQDGDFGRARASNMGDPLTFPFLADYALVVSPAFGGFTALFEFVAGGDNGFIFQPSSATPVGEFPSNSVIELAIPLSSLGTSSGADIDFVVTYGNNESPSFVSNESFPFQFGDNNPGNGAVTLVDFHRLTTVAIPEPNTFILALFGLAAAGLVCRCR